MEDKILIPPTTSTPCGYRPANNGTMLSRSASIRIGVALVMTALAIVWIGRWTDIDLQLADAVYDQTTGSFPLRDAWLTDTFNHQILKRVMTLLGASAIAAALADAIWPRRRFDHGPGRLRLRVIAWSAALVPLIISLFKKNSNSHCPWDLARYGGTEPYLRLFDALPAGVLPGHCLPAGHASVALWVMAISVCWLPHAPRKAAAAAAGAAVFGLAVGWLQQLRGAHFLTHTLWSIWLACTVVFALVLVLQRRPPARHDTKLPGTSLPS
jgi:membrane-associated PAP2 superfamily phosphatase